MSEALSKKVRRVVFKNRAAEANLILGSLKNSSFGVKMMFCFVVFFKSNTEFAVNDKGQLVFQKK